MEKSTYKCRICLGQELLTSIFRTQGMSMISTKIMSVAKVHISPNDGLPSTICTKCVQKVDECMQFIQLCEHSDLKLRALLHQTNDMKLNENKTSFDFYNNSLDNRNSTSPNSDTDKSLQIDENAISNRCKSERDEFVKIEDKMEFKIKDKKVQRQQCFTCGKVLSTRFRLKTHLRTHTGERPFSCPHCPKNFSLKQNLTVHMRVHTGEKPLHCTVCGESFAQSSGLIAHSRKHTGQMPYRCVLCPRSFRTVGHLQYHTRRHTGEKNFECESCGHAFITRSDLKQHLRTHTGDRPHVCCVCGLRVTRASHLKRHIQHMHGQKTYACNDCSFTFNDKEEFDKHKKIHVEADVPAIPS